MWGKIIKKTREGKQIERTSEQSIAWGLFRLDEGITKREHRLNCFFTAIFKST